MLSKIITFLTVFVLLLLLQGVSQSTETSAHPLLDKYYPRPQNNTDTNTTVSSQIKPVAQPQSSLAGTPVLNNNPIVPVPPVATTIRTTVTAPESANIPAENTAPPVTTEHALSNMPAASGMTSENEIPAVTPKPEVSASTLENKEPVETTAHSLTDIPKTTDLAADSSLPVVKTAPVVKNIIPNIKPAPAAKYDQISLPPVSSLYDTRLGSSTPQYDTWEKNNNGAGSVTTSPK